MGHLGDSSSMHFFNHMKLENKVEEILGFTQENMGDKNGPQSND